MTTDTRKAPAVCTGQGPEIPEGTTNMSNRTSTELPPVGSRVRVRFAWAGHPVGWHGEVTEHNAEIPGEPYAVVCPHHHRHHEHCGVAAEPHELEVI